jgi:C1A family cysteine protease
VDASRRFVYKTTRSLMRLTGDTGASLRTTMKALVLFGAPPEEHWPYRTREFDDEPPAFVYALAANYRALVYFRLDAPFGADHEGSFGSHFAFDDPFHEENVRKGEFADQLCTFTQKAL